MIEILRAIVLVVCVEASLSCIGLAQNTYKPVTATINVTTTQLTSSSLKSNWLTYNGDYTGRRYSSLKEITPGNVEHLRAQWVFHSRNAGTLEVTPIVVNGAIYITVSNDAYALNAETGSLLWHYSRSGLINA